MSLVDELMKLFYAARHRRSHQTAAANFSSTSVDGSGMVAFAGGRFATDWFSEATLPSVVSLLRAVGLPPHYVIGGVNDTVEVVIARQTLSVPLE